jgi:hypothetical protein
MNLKKIVKTFAISMLLAVTSTTANAQDLLARQAPVDRKMAAVDTIMLRNITMREELESPAADLYANWDNKYAHRATELPETFNIDLRHFTMPTEVDINISDDLKKLVSSIKNHPERTKIKALLQNGDEVSLLAADIIMSGKNDEAKTLIQKRIGAQ